MKAIVIEPHKDVYKWSILPTIGIDCENGHLILAWLCWYCIVSREEK